MLRRPGSTPTNTPSLPDPDVATGTDVVIFDGKCNFCIGGVRKIRWLDRSGKLSFLSLHDDRVGQRYPKLTHDELMDQMYVVEPTGEAHGGSDAVKYLSRTLPLLWPMMPILHLPGTARLWRWGYRQVAKRRYRLAGKTCQDSCSI